MFSFDEIYDEVMERVGGEQSTAEDVERVERSMKIVLSRWIQKRIGSWMMDHIDMPVTGSVPLALPGHIDDILQLQARSPEAVSWTHLERYHASRYQQVSTPDQAGRPTGWWLKRSPVPQLYVYPVGTLGAPETLRIWYVSSPDGVGRTGDMASMIPERMTEAFILGVAHDVARKRPGDGGVFDEALIARLSVEEQAALQDAQDADRDKARHRYRIRRGR